MNGSKFTRRPRGVAGWIIGNLLALFVGTVPATGQVTSLGSQLTSTITSQVLLLNTRVTSLGGGMYRWSFTLEDPFPNTVRIGFFTVAPRCDLSQISNLLTPPGWICQVFRRGDAPDAPKINWLVNSSQPGPL